MARNYSRECRYHVQNKIHRYKLNQRHKQNQRQKIQVSNLRRDEAIGNDAGAQRVQTTPLYLLLSKNMEKRPSLLIDHQPGRYVSSERKT